MIVPPLSPHALGAERSVLGAVLNYPDAMLTLQLRADDFYTDAHRRIYRAMLALAAENKGIDVVTVFEQLRRTSDHEDAGGAGYLTELLQIEPTGALFEHHAAIVREKSVTRELLRVGAEIQRNAYEQSQSAEEQVAAAERMVLAIGEVSSSIGDSVRPASEFMAEALQQVDDRNAGGGSDRISTGFAALDQVLGGLVPGEVYVIAARTSIGKTALALNILCNAATNGIPGLLFSLEMSTKSVANRLLAMGSGVPLHKFDRAQPITSDDAQRLIVAAGPSGIGGCPLFIDDKPGATAARIAAVTRRMVRRHGVKLLGIDYLGIMGVEDSRRPRVEQLGALTMRIKNIARECNVPILLLAQLNREVESRHDGKPRLSDLRESGSIEQDADVVLLLSKKPDQTGEVERVDLSIAKQRNGPTGDVVMNFRKAVVRFEDA